MRLSGDCGVLHIVTCSSPRAGKGHDVQEHGGGLVRAGPPQNIADNELAKCVLPFYL